MKVSNYYLPIIFKGDSSDDEDSFHTQSKFPLFSANIFLIGKLSQLKPPHYNTNSTISLGEERYGMANLMCLILGALTVLLIIFIIALAVKIKKIQRGTVHLEFVAHPLCTFCLHVGNHEAYGE